MVKVLSWIHIEILAYAIGMFGTYFYWDDDMIVLVFSAIQNAKEVTRISVWICPIGFFCSFLVLVYAELYYRVLLVPWLITTLIYIILNVYFLVWYYHIYWTGAIAVLQLFIWCLIFLRFCNFGDGNFMTTKTPESSENKNSKITVTKANPSEV